MLRMIFVIVLILAGIFFSLQSAFYGLLFYLWNAYFRPEFWSYGWFIYSLRLSLLIGAYVVIRTVLSGFRPRMNLQAALIWLFFMQAVVGCVTSEVPDLSWGYLNGFWKVMLMSYLIVILTDDRHKFRLVLVVITLSLGFETAKQGWANLVRAPGAANTNPNPFLGDNNGVALGLMMLLPIIGAVAKTSGRIWERNMHRFVGVGVLMRGICTYSRGGFLGAATLVVIGILRSERKWRSAIVAAVLVAGITALMPDAFWDRMNTITVDESQNEVRDESAASRLDFWHVAVDMANAKPLTGVGLNAFSTAFVDYNTFEAYAGQQRQTHSIWFGVLAELGYVGLGLFVSNIVLAFWGCWRVHRIARRHPACRDLGIYANALISSLSVYCVTGSFLSAQYSEMTWHLFALSAALHFIAQDEVRAGASTESATAKAA